MRYYIRMFGIGKKLKELFSKKLDTATLAELEETLISADISVDVAEELVAAVKRAKPEEARQALKDELVKILKPCEAKLELSAKPTSIVMLGVNGAGKTTTIGKLASGYAKSGLKVGIVACDTFRASATAQLSEWARRAHARLITREGSDPSGLAFDGMKSALSERDDIVFFDTAGRLGNNEQLLAEMAKIVRTIGKAHAGAPTYTLLVLDGGGGQNSLAQYENFSSAVQIDGIIAAKLDGTAKGGFLATLAKKHGVKIFFIGEGEGAGDLAAFNAEQFAEKLVG